MDEKLSNINNGELNSSPECDKAKDIKTDTKTKRKRLLKRIVLPLAGVIVGVPLIFVIVAGCIFGFDTVFYVLKQDNLTAFINSMRYSQEDIETKIEENHQRMEKVVDKNPLIEIRGGLTEEETKALAEGRITQEEAVKIVKGELTLEEILSTKDNTPPEEPSDGADSKEQTPNDAPAIPPEPDVPASTAPAQPQPKPESTPAADEVSTLVAELYVVQADFLSRLEAIGDSAYADYVATNYDRTKVDSIVNSYTATVGAMEAECDRKVNAIVKNLKAAIQRANGDMNLAKEVTNYYYTEKSLKKSYYINKIKGEDYK